MTPTDPNMTFDHNFMDTLKVLSSKHHIIQVVSIFTQSYTKHTKAFIVL